VDPDRELLAAVAVILKEMSEAAGLFAGDCELLAALIGSLVPLGGGPRPPGLRLVDKPE
jgi:hypothetical protein